MLLIDTRHPEHAANYADWIKFGRAYKAGHAFVDDYVEMFSTREEQTDFVNRKKYSYVPAFAKEAINEVKNAIFQRISDITREGGTEAYSDIMRGQQGGVDLAGGKMNTFIGRSILPELLVKSKVGVYVDMPIAEGDSKADSTGHPYLYVFKAEDILSWEVGYTTDGYYYKSLLLRHYSDSINEEFNLPDGEVVDYRYLYLENDGFRCDYYDSEGGLIETKFVNLPLIPFVIAELTHSLMEDVADYQIALVNLASSDMSYALRSNFPFYIEQTDLRLGTGYLRQNDGVSDNTEDNSKVSNTDRRSVGTGTGRQYPLGAHAPAFIHPSPEPLIASMAKQKQLKNEIRELVHLSLTSVEPKMASKESKEQDQTGLEAGLSYIGLELETLERMIARIWVLYEGLNKEITITYPRRYSIKSDEEKRNEAKELKELVHDVPSKIFKKEIVKRIANVILSDKISIDKMKAIVSEIDKADILDTDPEVISKDVESGLVGLKAASEARGYPVGESDRAKEDHAERLARIAKAQEEKAPRGVDDQDDEPRANDKRDKASSRDVTQNDDTSDKTRGDA